MVSLVDSLCATERERQSRISRDQTQTRSHHENPASMSDSCHCCSRLDQFMDEPEKACIQAHRHCIRCLRDPRPRRWPRRHSALESVCTLILHFGLRASASPHLIGLACPRWPGLAENPQLSNLKVGSYRQTDGSSFAC